MKKLLLLLAIAIFALSAASCEGPQGPPGPGTSWHIQEFTVLSADWKIERDNDGSNPRFVYTFNNFSRLTNFVYTKGNVSAFRVTGNTQRGLPDTRPFETGTTVVDETTTFEYGVGRMTFKVYFSDFDTTFQPVTMDFRVVLQW